MSHLAVRYWSKLFVTVKFPPRRPWTTFPPHSDNSQTKCCVLTCLVSGIIYHPAFNTPSPSFPPPLTHTRERKRERGGGPTSSYCNSTRQEITPMQCNIFNPFLLVHGSKCFKGGSSDLETKILQKY